MSVRRALVDCAVLSLQDTCVFYPCCKSCFSRIDAEQLDPTRYRCSRCAYRCASDQVDYRYRLSLRVTRDRCIFGVTVFGNSLNTFFGVHASGLQRIVEKQEGPAEPSTRSRLLAKAVQDCFIGRHFIFGLKWTGTERRPWFGDPGSNGSKCKERAEFVASQMILPEATGLTGCTVLSYYQILLQKAAEYEVGSADLAAPLLLQIPDPPASQDSLCASALLSPSLLRSPRVDSHSLTSSWHQSLGLVTSSPEEEEEEGSNKKTPCPALEDDLKKQKVSQDRLSLISSDHGFYINPSFTTYPNSSFGKALRTNVNACSGQSVRRSSLSLMDSSTEHPTPSTSSSSLSWEDFPFSESLSEFLHEQNKDFENEKPSANPAAESASARQTNTQILLDISNIPVSPGGEGHGGHNTPENKQCYEDEFNPEGDEAFQSSEKVEDNSYNCSADLFSNSLNRQTFNALVEPVASASGVCSLFYETEFQYSRNNNIMQLTPHKQKAYVNNSLILQDAQEFDFVPPSQSTPLVKTVTQSRASSHRISKRRFSRGSNIITPGRRLRTSGKNQKCYQLEQRAQPQRTYLNSESTEATNLKRDSISVTACDFEDDEGLIAPTPVGKTQQSVCSQKQHATENWNQDSDLTSKRSERENKRLLLDQTPASSHGSQKQTDNNNWTVHEGKPNESNDLLDDVDPTCDLSRDLFSDSV